MGFGLVSTLNSFPDHHMNSIKTLHVFGEIFLKRSIDEEVEVRVLCGDEWIIRGEAAPPIVGVMGGFEFSIDRDISLSISSWPRLEIHVGESRASMLIPAQSGSIVKNEVLRYLDSPWWTLGLCDDLEFTVTMHLIAES